MSRGAGRSLLLFATLAAAGCEAPADPPASPPRAAQLAPPPDASADAIDSGPADGGEIEAGSADPGFGGELASIATETSIYEEPRWAARRIGYLRAGAIVRRSAEPVATGPRCPEGWYRVEPRGFVCVGAMATLDVHHRVVAASSPPPREDGLPYLYALGRSVPPPLYARLPSRADQRRFEPDLSDHLAKNLTPSNLPPADPIPAWLAPGSPAIGLGHEHRGPRRVLLGHPKGRSGFALLATVDHDGRRFGVTTGLEMIPLDRTRIVEQSRFSGLALEGGVTLPVAFVRRAGAFRVIDGPRGISPGPVLGFREAVPVTDEVRLVNDARFVVARDGTLVREDQVTIVRPMRRPPRWAEEGGKWIEVSIPRQSLVAYEGTTPVYVTLVSTGVGGTADPEETHATVQGTFKIYEKHLTVTMDGSEASDSFDLRDVPFVQYFHKGYALHAAYWHDDFGHAHSHGCVNLAPLDAAWLFRWTDPRVPPGWHATMAREGTIVYVHD
ncbi:MAG: L,D-transpeptidase [Minicystis sp.]